MLTIVLGAPGSGKTTVAPRLQALRPDRVVLDWDHFMPAAELLAGADIRTSSQLWPAYRSLVRTVVTATDPSRTIVLGVCTPTELADWPPARWVVLDCNDAERRQRLVGRPLDEIESALADAREYRRLGLPIVDGSSLDVDALAAALAALVTSA